MAALLSVVWVGINTKTKLLPLEDYPTAYQSARMWIIVFFFAGLFIIAQKFSGRYPKSGETLLQSALAGVLVGLGLLVSILMVYGIEYINGPWDKTGHYVSLRIVLVNEYGGKHPHRTLVVEHFAETEPSSEIFWAGEYPSGWNNPGNCLLARTGKGLLGIRWIAAERIGSCKPLLGNGS